MSNVILKSTGWQRPLACPIRLRNRDITVTRAHAVELMTGFLPEHRQTKPIWQKIANADGR